MKPLDVNAVPFAGTALVEASAGTGKTFNIAQLYLRALVEQRLEPRQLLVVSYTKAATAELRRRLRGRLRAALDAFEEGAPADAVLAGWVDRRRAVGEAEADAAHLRRCLQEMDFAAILTIHAFAQRALREVPFSSRADFEVELLEDTAPLIERIARDFWAARLHGEGPSLVAYLREAQKLGPARLAKLARRAEPHPDAVLLPEDASADPAAGTRYQAAALEWAAAWSKERDAIAALLLAPEVLRGNVYSPKLVAGWCEGFDAEAVRPHPAPSWRIGAFHRWTPADIARYTRKGQRPPQHPFFALCAGLLERQAELGRWSIAFQIEFLRSVPDTLRSRLRRSGLRSFADLIADLRAALRDPGAGAELATELRRRYRIALIDESQDTDPVQAEIFARIWQAGDLPLFLVGDPKQAIYGFRGADVRSHLAAARSARTWSTLETSRRSGPRLVEAINALFSAEPRPFEPEAIAYRALVPQPDTSDRFDGPAFELLLLEDAASAAELDAAVCTGVAAEIETSLRTLDVAPHEVAVLCRTNAQARGLRAALRARGIPAVLHGDESVFDGDAAVEVERVARALARPGDAALLRAALATRLMGASAADIDALVQEGAALETWAERVQRAAVRWAQGGFAVGLRALLDSGDVTARLLAEPGGERHLTDALHVAELMHLAERQLHLGPSALVRWLAGERSGSARGAASLVEAAQLRLEGERRGVQLTTVHRSKGLEYEIVYVPFAWKPERAWPEDKAWPCFHDGERIALDLGSERHEASQSAAETEARGEAMRLLYVAVTRAKHRMSVVYAAAEGSEASALGRLLGCAAAESGPALRARLEARFAATRGVRVRPLAAGVAGVRPSTPAAAPLAAPRRLTRAIGRPRRTSSFSALVRPAPETGEGRDHDAHLEAAPGIAPAAGGFAGGAAVGLALHDVLEGLDFPGADFQEVARAVERACALHGVDARDHAALVRCVLEALDAPLAPQRSLRLRDVTRAQRVAELEFLIPVGDARRAEAWLRPARLAEPFARLAARPELRAYAERVASLRFAELAGHLRGFVDLVFRHEGRWYLVDYKSNDLGGTSDAYAPEQLVAPMCEHDYVLQYHLYSVALQRWLARRVPGFHYERDFGGVYYLFLRGLGPDRPPGSGIWFDRPPRALIDGLSAALARPGGRGA